MNRDRDPLSPLAGWTYLLLAVVGVLVLSQLYWAITGSLPGSGGPTNICVDEPSSGTADFGPWGPPHDPKAGVRIYTVGHSFCTTNADPAQRMWYALTRLPAAVLLLGVLVVLFRLVRGAARDGIHTAGTARRLRILGWLLIAGSLLAPLAQDLAKTRLLASMVSDPLGGYFLPGGGTPYTPLLPLVLVGVGLLTFGRFVLVGAEMRADLDGTV